VPISTPQTWLTRTRLAGTRTQEIRISRRLHRGADVRERIYGRAADRAGARLRRVRTCRAHGRGWAQPRGRAGADHRGGAAGNRNRECARIIRENALPGLTLAVGECLSKRTRIINQRACAGLYGASTGRTGKIGSRLRAANPARRDVLFLLSRPEPREGLTALISIQNNSGLLQGLAGALRLG
jgi:hypothetical protein